MTFRVGQKVVCVDDGLGLTGALIPECGLPTPGRIYTVAQVGKCGRGTPGVNIVELMHPIPCGWRATRFRPVV